MAFTLMDGRFMADREEIKGALDAVRKITPVKFTETGLGGGITYGVDGVDVSKVAPHAADIDGVGMARVDLVRIIPVLVAAIQELADKVDAMGKPVRAGHAVKPTPVAKKVE